MALYCSAHGFCSVEFDVACCAMRYTATAALTCIVPVVALYCSEHGCCAAECEVACCAKRYTATATLTPLDLVLYLVALTIPKQMVKPRDNKECWSKLSYVSWQSSPCLNQYGVICCIMLIFPSTQQCHRALGALYLSCIWRTG